MDATRNEILKARDWFDRNFTGDTVPFNFTVGGSENFRDSMGTWATTRTEFVFENGKGISTLEFSHPKNGLFINCVCALYESFPAVDWTVTVTNRGESNTPILSEIFALDSASAAGSARAYKLHHSKGSLFKPEAFMPIETPLEPGDSIAFTSTGGRPTNEDLCYFNLETEKEGTIIAVGWPGQWAGYFENSAEEMNCKIRIGQEDTHMYLKPGESIRLPLISLMFWEGEDWLRGQNIFRNWMLECNMPRPEGRRLQPMLSSCGSSSCRLMIDATEENQIFYMQKFIDNGLRSDCWQMDAGWYPVRNFNWANVGTWETYKEHFPRGIGPVSDFAHKNGIKTILWFEPERVTFDTWLSNTHPEWLIESRPNERTKLLDLGNPEAWNWLVDHFDKMIKDNGVDIYRQDFNMDPLAYWRANDEPDRRGIKENHHVTGYLRFWDELLRRNPGLLIDNCASGGRRDDLETMRRSFPLWRDDYCGEIHSQQCQTYGLSLWIPFFGTGTSTPDTLEQGKEWSLEYVFRSQMTPSVILAYDMRREDIDFDLIRRLTAQWKEVAEFYFYDYYPLTPYSLADDAWIAWQYHDEASGRGTVQAFRRADSPEKVLNIKPRHIDESKDYLFRDLASGREFTANGADLIASGLTIMVDEAPGAAIFVYRPNK